MIYITAYNKFILKVYTWIFICHTYNIMTTNTIDLINLMFFDKREYSNTILFDATKKRFAGKNLKRRMKFINALIIFFLQ